MWKYSRCLKEQEYGIVFIRNSDYRTLRVGYMVLSHRIVFISNSDCRTIL